MKSYWKNNKRQITRQRLLGLGLVLLGVFFLAPAVDAGILDLTWTAPTTNADGTPLTDLASYRVYYGTSNPVTCPGGSTFVTVPSATAAPTAGTPVNYRLAGLQTGIIYYVGVTAVDTSGNESVCSNLPPGVAARIEFSVTPSTTVNFGTVNIGSTADQPFTVQNIVGGAVSGTATTSAPFSIISGGSFNLPTLNATQTVTVRFTPTTSGTALGNVNFTADGDTISRGVAGTGAATVKAAITSPAPGSTLPGASVTFMWSAGSGASQYWLSVGSTPGVWDIYNASQGTSLSTTLSGLPTDGRTLYVRLFSQFSSGWQYNDYTYTAY